MEGLLQVVANQVDPHPEGARDDGGHGEQHQRGIPAVAQDPDKRRRLAFAGAGDDPDLGQSLLVRQTGDRFLEELVGTVNSKSSPSDIAGLYP